MKSDRHMQWFPVAPLRFATIVVLLTFVACADAQQANQNGPQPDHSTTPKSTSGVVRVAEIATGLEHPWGMAFLPDGRILVTEKAGRVRIVEKNGRISAPLAGVPAVHARGQGGLLDVALDPKFSENRYIYLSFSEPGGPGLSGTAVARAKLGNNVLEETKVIWRQTPKVEGNGHYGSRIVFARDGTMFVALGERMSDENRVHAQDLNSGLGKVMHLNSDGTPAKGNPFEGRKDAQPEIWSFGHRNIQAAALDPDGRLWVIEHGPRGGDELNRAEPGKNYGWPVIGYGREYSGEQINGGKRAQEGMEQPVFYWDPVIAPSGMIFYSGKSVPEWKGNVFVGSLQPGALVRLELRDGKVVKEERYLGERGERIRDVEEGPDGAIYLLTDEDNGKLLRVERISSK